MAELTQTDVSLVEELLGVLAGANVSEFEYKGVKLKFVPPAPPTPEVGQLNLMERLAKLPAIGPVPGDKPVLPRRAEYTALFGGTPPSFATETSTKVPE